MLSLAAAAASTGWSTAAITITVAVLALVGVVTTALINRAGNNRADLRGRREEAMRSLRWAAELAVDTDARKLALGVAQLIALKDSHLVDDDARVLIDAALEAAIEPPEVDVEAAGDDDVEVLIRPDDDVTEP